MPDYEDELNKYTFKDQYVGSDDETARRILDTIEAVGNPPEVPDRMPESRTAYKMAKAFGLLVQHLQSKGLISEEEIDEILFKTTR